MKEMVERWGELKLGSEARLVEYDEVPEEVAIFFDQKSGFLVAQPGVMEGILAIDHCDLGITYACLMTKEYSDSTGTERDVYLYEVDQLGEMLGYGELRFNISKTIPFFKDKPFVGYTFTEAKYLKQGFGTRRLRIMNALAIGLFGHRLNSDTALSESAERVWKKLVAKGEAEVFKEGRWNRYRFIE